METLRDKLLAGSGFSPGGLADLIEARATEIRFVADRFFVSIGFEPLPETFWTRSLFTAPRDREVVCHASAWM